MVKQTGGGTAKPSADSLAACRPELEATRVSTCSTRSAGRSRRLVVGVSWWCSAPYRVDVARLVTGVSTRPTSDVRYDKPPPCPDNPG
ncbi:hypothetical protein [Streptomyces sp. Je 1-369]|uniref:hypothetical protein n=1 Tax=Streptomyces sp. Je 1-369 TaxID=2966192 RepID=UPI0022858FB3|nr:hypothetical protein [Streptomyces sp. Je 1-369]WAL99545.1 hypothetical protein NOO62_36795 [Streptomyces sp. Je 1-369]